MSIRLERLQADYKTKINHLLKTEVNNEYASYCNVTEVRIASDLSHAKVYIDTLANHEKALTALRRVSGFLRSQLAKTSNIRKVPKLLFTIDDSIHEGNRIEQILNELKNK